MTEDRDLLDDVLDRALAAHGRCEPRPGLEGRVLATLRSAPSPTPWWKFPLGPRLVPVALGAVTVAGIVVTSLVLTRAGSRPGPAASVAASPAPTAPPAATAAVRPAALAPAAPAAPERVASRAIARDGRTSPLARTPRRPSFPHPSPLSEEERLLLRYVSETPREEAQTRAGFLDEPAPLPPLPDSPTTD